MTGGFRLDRSPELNQHLQTGTDAFWVAAVSTANSPIRRALGSLVQWIDSDYSIEPPEVIRARPDGVNLVRTLPFVFLHLGCLGFVAGDAAGQ